MLAPGILVQPRPVSSQMRPCFQVAQENDPTHQLPGPDRPTSMVCSASRRMLCTAFGLGGGGVGSRLVPCRLVPMGEMVPCRLVSCRMYPMETRGVEAMPVEIISLSIFPSSDGGKIPALLQSIRVCERERRTGCVIFSLFVRVDTCPEATGHVIMPGAVVSRVLGNGSAQGAVNAG